MENGRREVKFGGVVLGLQVKAVVDSGQRFLVYPNGMLGGLDVLHQDSLLLVDVLESLRVVVGGAQEVSSDSGGCRDDSLDDLDYLSSCSGDDSLCCFLCCCCPALSGAVWGRGLGLLVLLAEVVDLTDLVVIMFPQGALNVGVRRVRGKFGVEAGEGELLVFRVPSWSLLGEEGIGEGRTVEGRVVGGGRACWQRCRCRRRAG